MKLIIVESPTKAKTIKSFLPEGYGVESSYGHIRDLPQRKFGIDIEKNFEPQYVVPKKAIAVVKKLKELAKKSEEVILATDEDREGEAIAWHLVYALGLNRESPRLKTKSKKLGKVEPKEDAGIKNIKRIVFHEITKSAIENALKNPRDIDANLVDSQQARRLLDRIVGYKLSPFLWKKVVKGLSAGRVQSVALRLIAEREKEILDFKSQEYWTIIAALNKQEAMDKERAAIEAQLAAIDNKKLEKFDIQNKEAAEKLADDIKGLDFVVDKIEKEKRLKNPASPFITSTLQQESYKRLHFSSKKTMVIAQMLYEKGFITYMRTDSVNIAAEALNGARDWIQGNLGEKYLPEKPRIYKTKSKLAQEAHECIRPTNVKNQPDAIHLESEDEEKLYALIWQRFVAGQMKSAEIENQRVEISAGKYMFSANGQVLKFDGYLKIWQEQFSEKELPELNHGEKLLLEKITPFQHFTQPPARYNDASLIKTLEKLGIGRPSTYASIISVLQERNYVEKSSGCFMPTEIGVLVNKVLVEHFPETVDINFTAKLEDELDDVARGKVKWQDLLFNFYKPFSENLSKKYQEVSKNELAEEKTDELCDKCGGPMIIKLGRYGRFMACSKYPECKNVKSLAKEPPKSTGLKCPKCMVGEIVERKINKGKRRGRIFWGCSAYPKCDYATWEKPDNRGLTQTETQTSADQDA